jgi:hypothetical protein
MDTLFPLPLCPNRLTILTDEIRQELHAALMTMRRGYAHARNVGLRLIEAKELVQHGQWLPWLEGLGLAERTAQEYMQLGRLDETKALRVADLGLRGALEVIARRKDPSALRPQPVREGPDFWPTPFDLISVLVRHVLPELPVVSPIWECAAGDGRLATAIRAAGRDVIATDLYPQDSSAPHDFLDDEVPAEAAGAIAITNPPYNKSAEFLAHGLALLDRRVIDGLVLLLRHDHLMSSEKIDAFNRAVREVHCNWRPLWIEGTDGNPRWSFHWLAWHAGPRRAPLYLREEAP